MYYLKIDYSTDLKTIRLDHSYSNVQLNSRSKYLPTSYIFKKCFRFLDDHGDQEADVLGDENDYHGHNSMIADKYFDESQTLAQKNSVTNTAFVANAWDKGEHDPWPIEVNRASAKKYKELIYLLHGLQLKLDSTIQCHNIERLAMDRNDIEEAYVTFLKHLFYFKDKAFRCLKEDTVHYVPGLSWIHEALVRSDKLIPYIHLLQVLTTQCPSLSSAMIKDHTRKLNWTAREALHLLLQSPWHIVPRPLQALSQQVNFILAPAYHSVNACFLPITFTPCVHHHLSHLKWPQNTRASSCPYKPSQLLHSPLKFLKKSLQLLGSVHVIRAPPHIRSCQQRNTHHHSNRTYRQIDIFSNNNNNNTNNKNKRCTENERKAYIHHVVSSFERKVREIRSNNNGVIVLLCHHTSSLLSYLMPMENISALICFGFPISNQQTASNIIKAPTLFVIGQEANNCPMESLEMITRSTNQTTGIVLVGGANENLNLSLPFRLEHRVTQSMADTMIANVVRDFVSHVLQANTLP